MLPYMLRLHERSRWHHQASHSDRLASLCCAHAECEDALLNEYAELHARLGLYMPNSVLSCCAGPYRRRYMMPLFAGACVASAAFPTWFLINADVGHMPLAVSFAAGFVGGMLASPPGPNARWRPCTIVVHAACQVTAPAELCCMHRQSLQIGHVGQPSGPKCQWPAFSTVVHLASLSAYQIQALHITDMMHHSA